MDAVIRALVIYAFLYVVFRAAGKRALSEMNAFDLLLLLIISEATQQAMVDNDNSITHALVLITTLVGIDIILSLIKQRSPAVERVLDSVPLVLIEDGKAIKHHMTKERVDDEDVLQASREQHGVSDLTRIHLAILETNGQITVLLKST